MAQFEKGVFCSTQNSKKKAYLANLQENNTYRIKLLTSRYLPYIFSGSESVLVFFFFFLVNVYLSDIDYRCSMSPIVRFLYRRTHRENRLNRKKKTVQFVTVINE